MHILALMACPYINISMYVHLYMQKKEGEGKRDRIQFNILEFLLGLGRVAEEVDLKVAL